MKRSYAMRISLGYAVFAALWILLSDAALFAIGLDVTSSALFSTIKGLTFVAVTASVLYLLIRRVSRSIESSARGLLVSETRYRDLIESVSDVVWEADEQVRCTFVGRQCEELLGLEPEAVLGKTMMELTAEHDRPALVEAFAKIRDGKPPYEPIRTHVLHQGSSPKIIESTVLPVRDKDGVFRGYRGVSRDVTEREVLSRNVRESMEFLGALIRVAPVPIVAIDRQGFVTIWNPAATEVFGWTAEEVLGKPNPIIRPDQGEEYRVLRQRVLEGETLRDVEVIRRDSHGRDLRIKLHSAALLDPDGSVTGVMAVLQDVTEEYRIHAELVRYRENLQGLVDERTEDLRNLNEDLLAATQTKSAFLANMSHELRTPLNAVIGFTGILLNGLAGPVNEEQHKQLTMAHGAGQHLLELINDILDLSKIEAGRTEIHPEPVLVSAIVEHVGHAGAALALERGLVWRTDVDRPDLELFTDGRRVEQVLLNLVGNAVKFTTVGSVTLAVTVHDERVRFSVQDTGPGIARDRQEDIFEEFIQGQARDDALTEGTGLGLSIARHLAGLLGGTLMVESELGMGSTFTLEMPITFTCSAPDEGAAQHGKVLVVIDDPEFVERCEYALHPAGFRVVWAQSSAEALDILAEDRPAVAIVDGEMMLPGGTGLVERIATDPQGPRVSVIRVGAAISGDVAITVVNAWADAAELVVAVRTGMALRGITAKEST
ncbi:MAG: PAS domain S-box protein [Coriobacteriia bacterium]|nr:PAS domain S-box protein [Coriobacteriia bacterium]MBN2823670.1 PAS domain S-box protein [Coriobacteriia bacterium]